jgi:hypothetical protein
MKYLYIGILAVFMILSACSNSRDGLDLSAYNYNDTKNLVRFVHNAAIKIENSGLAATEEYKSPKGINKDFDLYVYDMQGINLFHAGTPEVENMNLRNITDIEGKRVIDLVFEALNNPENPHGWVHYTWWEPGKFYPVPKSSCHFKVKMPDGREVFVGSGINYPLEESEYARITVDSAVNLITAKGSAALAVMENATSSYNFRDIKVFAFRPDGKIVISPILGDSLVSTNLLSCVDEVGNKPFEHALKQFGKQTAVWQIFMAKSRYERQLVKKTLYLRKTMLNNEPLYVGAVTDLPQTP